MNRVCLILGIGGIVILPLVYSTQTVDPAFALRAILLSAILAVCGIWLSVKGQSELSSDRISITVLGFIGAYLLLALISLRGGAALADGLVELTRILIWVGVIVLTLTLTRSESKCVPVWSRAASVSALVLSVIAVAQTYGWAFGEIPGHGVPSATMVNRNLLASALVLLLPWTLYAWYSDNRAWRIIALVATLMSAHIIVVVQSRAAWLAAAAGAVMVIALWRFIGRGLSTRVASTRLLSRRLLTISALVVVVVAFSVVTTGLTDERDAISDRLRSSVNFETGSVAERLALWQASLQMVGDHPLRGVGLGRWRIEQPAHGSEGLRSVNGDTFYQRPHNDFLWVGSEIGVLALIAYLGIFLTAIVATVDRLRNSSNASERLAAVMIGAGLIAYMVVAFFSYPRERVAHLLLSGMLIGTALAPVANGTRRMRSCSSRVVGVGLLVIAIAGIVVGLFRYKGEAHTMAVWQAIGNGDLSLAQSEARAAESFLYHIDPVSTPMAWYIGVAQLERGDVEKAKRSIERALTYTPNHPHVLANLAACYERGGDHERAAELYEQAVTLAPRFHEALVNLGAVYFNARRYDTALSVLNRAAVIERTAQIDEYLMHVHEAMRLQPDETDD